MSWVTIDALADRRLTSRSSELPPASTATRCVTNLSLVGHDGPVGVAYGVVSPYTARTSSSSVCSSSPRRAAPSRIRSGVGNE